MSTDMSLHDGLFDVSPDGQRLLALKRTSGTKEQQGTRFIIVLNWFEELKERVPVP